MFYLIVWVNIRHDDFLILFPRKKKNNNNNTFFNTIKLSYFFQGSSIMPGQYHYHVFDIVFYSSSKVGVKNI